MVSTEKRHIRSGVEYDHLFPKPEGDDILINADATVEDTIKWMPGMIKETLDDTKEIAKVLKGKNIYETCRNIWNFIYQHVPYKKDEKGKEQVRRPARVWHDRKVPGNDGKAGCDCDCYTSIISSILSNLSIPHALRICKYWYTEGRYTHIYPVVPVTDGKHITIDCVVNRFNYEEPFTEKHDTPMELHYLNGIEPTDSFDYGEMSGDDFGDDFGILKKLKLPFNKPASTSSGKINLFNKPGGTSPGKPTLFNKAGKVMAKGLNITNKINPATTLLRVGLLASMKLNLFKVAEKLKYAYLSEAEAQKRGLNMDRYRKYKQVLEKTEKIFYGAGGNPANLRIAILTGKGNPSKEVSGLGFNENSPLPVILGEEIYNTEVNADGMQGLGEIALATSLASASASMALIAGILKSIGEIKEKIIPGKGKTEAETSAEIEKINPTADDGSTTTAASDAASDGSALPAVREPAPGETLPATNAKSGDATASSNLSQEGFWDKNKKWIIPTGIGLGVAGLIFGISKATKQEKPKQGVSGLEGHREHCHQHHGRKGKRRRRQYMKAERMRG